MNKKTKKIAVTGSLCALAYAATLMGRVPLVLFLKYDPKDIVIAVGGLLFGPASSFSIALIVSLAEMFTISENGVWGFLMNVLSSASFACTAAWIYQKRSKRRRGQGAAAALLCGWGCMVLSMTLWNYLIAPVYLGCPRGEVVQLLVSAFLPFNLIKGGLNAAAATVLYRPVAAGLKHAHLIEQSLDKGTRGFRG